MVVVVECDVASGDKLLEIHARHNVSCSEIRHIKLKKYVVPKKTLLIENF